MDRTDSIDITVSSSSELGRLYKTLLCGKSFVLSIRIWFERVMADLRFCKRRCSRVLLLNLMEHAYSLISFGDPRHSNLDTAILNVNDIIGQMIPLQMMCAPRPSMPGTHIVSQLL